MRKIFSVILIIFLFSGFAVFNYIRQSKVKVLKIITPSEIVIDFNSNGIADIDEHICIDIDTLTAKLFVDQKNLQKKLNLNYSDAIKFGYLSDNYAENLLADKYVHLKYSDKQNYKCKYADIIINGDSYKNRLITSGFGFENGNPSGNFEKQLEKAKKLNLVILNHKSGKYHKLDCPYGIVADDAVILPLSQISKDASSCKYCHVDKKEKHISSDHKIYPSVISTGSIKLYLTDLTEKLKPDNKCSNLVCKEVLFKINNAKSEIDIALYGYDNISEISNALKSAKSRGVKIYAVYDNSKTSYYPETKTVLELADKKTCDGYDSLMHNKFIIFDNETLITGSMNFSKTGFSGFNTNSLIVINSKDIAAVYKTEFLQMLNGKFSKLKSKTDTKQITIGNTKIKPLFSPQDKIVDNHIIPLVNSAKTSVYIPVFVITHNNLAQALINAKKRGVDVKVIVDAAGLYSTGSKVKLLRNNGVLVKVENYAGKLHSKSIIIDNRYIVTGSMNFTNSGENKNDENILIIEDERLAKYYKGFFEYLWSKIPDKYLYRNIRAESKESIGSCSDGIDNNYDGKIDMQDAGCK